jgi:hypothetical protein
MADCLLYPWPRQTFSSRLPARQKVANIYSFSTLSSSASGRSPCSRKRLNACLTATTGPKLFNFNNKEVGAARWLTKSRELPRIREFIGNGSLSEGDWRLDSAETPLVDLEGFDLRVQGRSWHPKPGGGSRGAGNAAAGLGKCGLNAGSFLGHELIR